MRNGGGHGGETDTEPSTEHDDALQLDEGGESAPLAGSIYTPEAAARRLWLAKVLPFHYGYVILVVCGIGLGMSGPGASHASRPSSSQTSASRRLSVSGAG